MAGIRSLTSEGSEIEVKPEAIAALGQALRGRLLTADDGEYGDARQIWNGMIDRRPSLIARGIDTADVIGAPGGHRLQSSPRRYDLVILSGWTDPADDDKSIAWTRELWDALAPYSLGVIYVNSIVDDDEATVKTAYRDNTYRRLTELEARYDPTNLFRLNPNTKPAAG